MKKITDIQELKSVLKVETLRYDGDIRLKIKKEGDKVEFELSQKHNRTANRILSVDFGGGEVLKSSRSFSASKVLEAAVTKIGPQKVLKLGIVTSGGENLIVNSIPSGTPDKSYLKIAEGYYLITKTATTEKYYQLMMISQLISSAKAWKVELMPDESN